MSNSNPPKHAPQDTPDQDKAKKPSELESTPLKVANDYKVLNSAVDEVLLTVFGQGLLGAINEQTGDWLPISRAMLKALLVEAQIQELAKANTELYQELGLHGSNYLRDRIAQLNNQTEGIDD